METATLQLIYEARRATRLHLQHQLADFLGVSVRTIKRYSHRGGFPLGTSFAGLVQRVHPVNPTLAVQLAHATATPLAPLGIEDPTAPAAPATPASPSLPSARKSTPRW